MSRREQKTELHSNAKLALDVSRAGSDEEIVDGRGPSQQKRRTVRTHQEVVPAGRGEHELPVALNVGLCKSPRVTSIRVRLPERRAHREVKS